MIDIRCKVTLNTDQLARALQKGSTAALHKAALLIEAEAKELLSKGGKHFTGSASPYNSQNKVAYTPSDPGQPPHLISGNLRASVKVEKTEVGNSFRIGPSAIYGRIHEFGGMILVTKKMRNWLGMNLGLWKSVGSHVYIPKRPFMHPALDRCISKFPKLFENIPLGGTVS